MGAAFFSSLHIAIATLARQQTVLFQRASWSEGVRNTPAALTPIVQQQQIEAPHSTPMTLQQALRRGGRRTKAPLMQASLPQTNRPG